MDYDKNQEVTWTSTTQEDENEKNCQSLTQDYHKKHDEHKKNYHPSPLTQAEDHKKHCHSSIDIDLGMAGQGGLVQNGQSGHCSSGSESTSFSSEERYKVCKVGGFTPDHESSSAEGTEKFRVESNHLHRTGQMKLQKKKTKILLCR